ncbi:hypothetical protein PRIPAC_92402 [Pristionchus pacificus]|uniref:RING-type domain-containing protein n=1 Tax=Pristionchus pacificus TaxID=54126 RepID=A0A2A6BB69_PRIPA|nr:hypothetical protein PRIPAC_92402 [Pristionchus pacificus]|eukprot:PDM63120.1 hypothetical protein PRIPAC_50335 [Pristionchus pacificus]
MADDDVERLRELEEAMGGIGEDAVNRRGPLDDHPNDGNGLNQMAVDEDMRLIMEGMDPEEIEMNRMLLMDAERRQRRRERGEDRDAAQERDVDAFARAVMGVGLAPLVAPALVARAFGEPIPPPRVPFPGLLARRANPNWRDEQLRDWGDGQEQQQVQQLQQQDLQRQQQQMEQRQLLLQQRRARHHDNLRLLFGREREGAARPAVVMRRIVRGGGGEGGDGEEALLRGHGIDLVQVVDDLLMDGGRGEFGGVRLEFGGGAGGAVTEEMKKEAQMLREKDERTPCATRFSRACPICVIENPYQRAVFIQCGHIVCYSCAVDNASSDATNGKCVFCRKQSNFVKLYEEVVGSEKKDTVNDENESKTEENCG